MPPCYRDFDFFFTLSLFTPFDWLTMQTDTAYGCRYCAPVLVKLKQSRLRELLCLILCRIERWWIPMILCSYTTARGIEIDQTRLRVLGLHSVVESALDRWIDSNNWSLLIGTIKLICNHWGRVTKFLRVRAPYSKGRRAWHKCPRWSPETFTQEADQKTIPAFSAVEREGSQTRLFMPEANSDFSAADFGHSSGIKT